jgi:pimeloyl-ACP methyl ester carboxylesterase
MRPPARLAEAAGPAGAAYDCALVEPREVRLAAHDDDLTAFESQGTPALPAATSEGYVPHDGARIWYETYGRGAPVVLLHGGLGHGGNWAHQVPALVAAGHRAVLIDSRGHGRSTRDARPFSYDLLAADVLAVLDALSLERPALVGWSDGACTALVLAHRAPARAAGVFFFGCNMDPSGVKEFQLTAVVDRCFSRHARDYARLSSTPDDFQEFVAAVGLMQRTQPDYSAQDLAELRVAVTVAHAEGDEFIRREHAEYLARSIPGAELILLPGVSHFAPLQRPDRFNAAVLAFLGRALGDGAAGG